MIINCTPHAINFNFNGNNTTFEPSGIIPRVSTIEVEAQEIAGFPCVTNIIGNVEGMPEKKPGTFLIVSGMVFGASNRPDLIAPDTGKTAVRNDKGHIIAVTRFLRK